MKIGLFGAALVAQLAVAGSSHWIQAKLDKKTGSCAIPKELAVATAKPWCRFDAEKQAWVRSGKGGEKTLPVGLYWEKGTTVFCGPILCNDLHIGTAPPGTIAICVPFADRGTAMFVPAPENQCR